MGLTSTKWLRKINSPSCGLSDTHDLACSQGRRLEAANIEDSIEVSRLSESEEMHDEMGGNPSRLAASLNGFR